jgi:hypothetical protein
MTRITATVKGGVIVPDEPLTLPEGTHVVVEVPARDWILGFAGSWKDDPGIDEWLRERKRSRTMTEGRAL